MFGTYRLTNSYVRILPKLFQIFGEKVEVKILTYTEDDVKILWQSSCVNVLILLFKVYKIKELVERVFFGIFPLH